MIIVQIIAQNLYQVYVKGYDLYLPIEGMVGSCFKHCLLFIIPLSFSWPKTLDDVALGSLGFLGRNIFMSGGKRQPCTFCFTL